MPTTALALTLGTTELIILGVICALLWATRGATRSGTTGATGRELGTDLRLLTGPTEGEPASRSYRRAIARRRREHRRALRARAQERADAWVSAELRRVPPRLQELAKAGRDSAFFPYSATSGTFPEAVFPAEAADPLAPRRALARVAKGARSALVSGLRESGVRARFGDGAVAGEAGGDLRFGLHCRW
jgi:hypothetical protein